MNILDILGCAGDIRKVTAGAVLSAFGFSGCTAGVHQKEGSGCRHWHGIYPGSVIIFQQIIDKEVPALNHGSPGGIFARVTLPYKDLINLLICSGRLSDGDVKPFLCDR